MFDFLARLFRSEPSGAKAKERLRLVLLSDHLALAPDVVESLKTDLLEVISRYVEVDIEHVDVTFEQREHEVAMLANVPILSMKAPHERPRPLTVAAQTLNLPLTVDSAPQAAPLEPTAAAAARVAVLEPVEGGASNRTEDAPAGGAEHAAPDDSSAAAAAVAGAAPHGTGAAEVIALPMVATETAPVVATETVPAKLPRSRRRRRRKASVNGTLAQQSKPGAVNQTHL